MKTTIIAAFAALGLTTSIAFAEPVDKNFDNTVASVTATHGIFSFTLEAAKDEDYKSATVAATVLTYGLSDTVDSALDVYVTHYDDKDAYGIGADYTATHTADALSVYGVVNVEYISNTGDVNGGDFYTAPTLGASYAFNDTVSAYSEVSYAWNMSDDFSRQGGEFELGASIALADTITFTPALVRSFDTGNDVTQAQLGLSFSF